MSELPSSIRNLGPASDKFYGKAGLTTAQKIRNLGADESYLRAIQAGGKPHFIGYYALVMGLQNRPWNDCHTDEKTDLRRRFEDIKKCVKRNAPKLSDLERALDLIGVRARKSDQPTNSNPKKK